MGARLARDGGGTFNIAASCPTAIASKLSSHRGFVVKAGSVPLLRDSMWEQGLPAMGGHIQHRCKLSHRHREQAQLPQGICGKGRICALLRDSMWEQGLPAMGWHIQHRCKLSHRHREQAQLPQRICAEGRICAPPSRFNVGARLARDGGGTFNIAASCPTAIASKLSSHRGFVVKAGSVPLLRDSMWEQGLPAMAAAHSTSLQADPPLSRASSAPTEDLC